MDNKNKQLSLIEKWELDIKSYKQGANVETAAPQCEKCKYYIKGNALNCKIFRNESKPEDVMFCESECCFFVSNNMILI